MRARTRATVAGRRWVQSVVRTGIAELPEHERQVIVLGYAHGPVAGADRRAPRVAARDRQVADAAGAGPAPAAARRRWATLESRARRARSTGRRRSRRGRPMSRWITPPPTSGSRTCSSSRRGSPRSTRSTARRTSPCASTSRAARLPRRPRSLGARPAARSPTRCPMRRDRAAAAVEPIELPPSLRARGVLTRGRASRASGIARARSLDGPAARSRRAVAPWLGLAASLIVLVGAGVDHARPGRAVVRLPRREAHALASAVAAVDRVLAAPDHRIVDAPARRTARAPARSRGRATTGSSSRRPSPSRPPTSATSAGSRRASRACPVGLDGVRRRHGVLGRTRSTTGRRGRSGRTTQFVVTPRSRRRQGAHRHRPAVGRAGDLAGISAQGRCR